ncbi:MAG: hypothetical protein ACM37Z_14195, partial [Deltaproteobacteria bacterium]
MAKIGRAAPHNEAEHHLRRAVLSVGSTIHRVNVKISSLSLQESAQRIQGSRPKLLMLSIIVLVR